MIARAVIWLEGTSQSRSVVTGFSNFGDPAMEKALERLAGGGSHGSGTNAPSKGFQMLIKGIAEAKTKHVRTAGTLNAHILEGRMRLSSYNT